MAARRATEQDLQTGQATVEMSTSPGNHRSGPPNPDPTILVTQQLLREISNLKEYVETRLEANDKAIELIQSSTNAYRDKQDADRVAAIASMSSLIVAQIAKLEEVTLEKFQGVSTQFQERDKRTEQLSVADKTAIAAALQAQKEAAGAQNDSNAASVTKQEAAFTKLIDQTQQTQAAQNKSMDDKINGVFSRLDRGEGRTRGIGDGWAVLAAVIGIAIGIGALVVAIIR